MRIATLQSRRLKYCRWRSMNRGSVMLARHRGVKDESHCGVDCL
jgi:hypothetical protein